MNNSITFEKRNLIAIFFLFILTGGLYFFYWLYKTKTEINKIGGNIPTFWFAILPFFNIFFDYRYSENYIQHVKGSKDDTASVIAYFALLLFLPGVAMIVIQYELNNYKA